MFFICKQKTQPGSGQFFIVNKKRPTSDIGRLYLSKNPVLNQKCGEFIEHIFKHVPKKGIIRFLIVEKTMIKHWVSVDTL